MICVWEGIAQSPATPEDRIAEAMKLIKNNAIDGAVQELTKAESEFRQQRKLVLASRCQALSAVLTELSPSPQAPLLSLHAEWKFVGEIQNGTVFQQLYIHESGEQILNTVFQGESIDFQSLTSQLRQMIVENKGIGIKETSLQNPQGYQLNFSNSALGGKTSAFRLLYENSSTSMVFISDLDKAFPIQPVAEGSASQARKMAGGGGDSRPTARIQSFSWFIPLGILVVLLGLTIAVVVVVLRSRNREIKGRIQASLEIITSDGSHQFYRMRKYQTRIGRAGDNDLILIDSDVSAHHAVLDVRADGFYFQDLGSTNGSFVNGQRVSNCSLFLDDRLLLGSTRVILKN